jgi:hypothetical protein
MDPRGMDSSQIDDRIRGLFRESAFRPDMSSFKAGLRERLSSERRLRPSQRRSRLLRGPWRVAALAGACLVLLGALGYGIYEAVERLREPEPVLVIDDEAMLGGAGASSAYDNVLPPGVSAVVGVSGSSLWCLSRERGLTSLDVDVTEQLVTTGTKGDLVAYTAPSEVDGSTEIFLWDTNGSGAENVTRLDVGDPSEEITTLEMSPDGSKLLVVQPDPETSDPDLAVFNIFVVDLATRTAGEWEWDQESAPPVGADLGNVVWSPASDAFYVSFAPPAGDEATGYCYRCDLGTGFTSAWGNLAQVSDASNTTELVELVVVYGPEGPDGTPGSRQVSVAVWVNSFLDRTPLIETSATPVTQDSIGPVFISSDGESVVLQGYSTNDAGEESGVLEVMRQADEVWSTTQVVALPSLDVAGFAGFAGGNLLYFAAGPPGLGVDSPGRVQVGVLDPTIGEYQLYDALPVDDCLWVAGLWTGPESPETPDEDTSTTVPDTSTTIPNPEPTSTTVPVTVPIAEPPIVEVTGEVVFSAGWGDAVGEFGIQRADELDDTIIAGPSAFWVTPDEKLYVLDPVNRRVQMVGTDGVVESVITVQMESPQDVAVAADGTVLVSGPSGIEAYSRQGDLLDATTQSADGPWAYQFVADETTVYSVYQVGMGLDSTNTDLYLTKYVPAYRDGELLEPEDEWDAAPSDQPLGQGLGLRVGDHALGEAAAWEAVGNIHVFSGDERVFSAALSPADYGSVTGVATEDGEVVVTREWIAADDPPAVLAHSVWVFSFGGTPLRRTDVTQSLYGTLDGSRMARFRLTPGGALFAVGTTSDGVTITRYDLGAGGEGAGGAGALTLPEQMPADFGFVAHYGPGRDALDTLAATCRKELINEYPVEAELRLTDAEMQELYRDLVEMDITQYDAHHLPAAGDAEVDEPWDRYSLDIWIGGVTVKYVRWEDNAGATDERSEALRAWFGKLQGMIEAKPEWQALPPRSGTWDDLG